jgi:hypothetical protein
MMRVRTIEPLVAVLVEREERTSLRHGVRGLLGVRHGADDTAARRTALLPVHRAASGATTAATRSWAMAPSSIGSRAQHRARDSLCEQGPLGHVVRVRWASGTVATADPARGSSAAKIGRRPGAQPRAALGGPLLLGVVPAPRLSGAGPSPVDTGRPHR